jgi:hypothetical protein
MNLAAVGWDPIEEMYKQILKGEEKGKERQLETGDRLD